MGLFFKLLIYLVYKMATSSQNKGAGPAVPVSSCEAGSAVHVSSCEAGHAVPVSSCEAGPAVPVFDKKDHKKRCITVNRAVQTGDMSLNGMRRLSAFPFHFLYQRLQSTLVLNILRKRSGIFQKNAEDALASDPESLFSRNEPAIASDRMNREAIAYLVEIRKDYPEWLDAWECVIYCAFQSLAVAFPERTKQTPEGDVIIVFEGFKNGLEKPKHYDDCGFKPFKQTN